MANQAGEGTNGSRKSRKLTYFFLNGKLHKSLHINRAADLITAWSYPEHKRVGYTYSDVKRRHGKAFTTREVAKMINRGRVVLENAIINGHIETPQHTYGFNNQQKKYKYMWSEENVMDLHAYLSTVHFGRPRNDGLVNPYPMPSARELRALMRHSEVLYIKKGDKFIPLWEADE